MMENWTSTHAAPVEGELSRSHIAELYLPQASRPYGFEVGGLAAGPNVLVGCHSALARQVYQRLLLIPSLNRIRGRLFLLALDRLGDFGALGSLDELPGVTGPIDRVMTLPSIELDALDDRAAAELVRRNYYAVLRLCARMGMVQGRGIPDRDAPLTGRPRVAPGSG